MDILFSSSSSSSSSQGRIAQSVERWSNKPLVMGSIPIVTTFFAPRGKVHLAGKKFARAGKVIFA